MPVESKIRKYKLKEDCISVVDELIKKVDISPYTQDQLVKTLVSACRSGEATIEERKDGLYLIDVDKWFLDRIKPNTVVLSFEDYVASFFRSFRLLVLGNIAKTDFGGSRQRDFGQLLTDFTRGFLGEIGIKRFFKQKLNLDVEVEEARIGTPDEFMARDIVKVKESGNYRDVKAKISVKTSKLGSMWLDVGNQISHSEFFAFMKIGLTTEHLTTFMKETGFIDSLVKLAVKVKEIKEEDMESIRDELLSKIKNFHPIPAYVSGFVEKEKLENGELITIERRNKKKEVVARKAVGGLGMFDKNSADEVEGLGSIKWGKHIASLGSLNWKQEDWNTIKEKI